MTYLPSKGAMATFIEKVEETLSEIALEESLSVADYLDSRLTSILNAHRPIWPAAVIKLMCMAGSQADVRFNPGCQCPVGGCRASRITS